MKRKLCIEVGKSYAIDLFVDMLNPKNQGAGFKWENFPNLVERLCRAGLFASFTFDRPPTQAEEDLAGETARKWAEESIKRAGLV